MDKAKKSMDWEYAEVQKQFTDSYILIKATPADPAVINVAINTLDYQINDLMDAQKIYLEHCRSTDNEAEYKATITQRNDVRKKRLVLGTEASKLVSSGSTTSSTATGSSSASGASVACTHRIKVPKRELRKFDGDVRNWRSFWASFKEIDSDATIPDIEKYNCLLESTNPGTRPYPIVSSYPPDGPSYYLARDELEDKFGRVKTLIKVYIRDLLKLVVDNASEKKSLEFTEMVTSLTAQTRNLEQLGLTHDKFGVFLYPIVESCVPQEVLTRYLQKVGVKEEIKDILDFLNEEVKRKDETELAQGSFTSVSTKQSKSNNNGKGKEGTPTAVSFINSNQRAEKLCGFCGFKHSTVECRKAVAMTYDERKGALQKSRSCFKCLQTGHSSKNCKSHVICFNCKKGHHTLMCWESNKEKGKDTGITAAGDQRALPTSSTAKKKTESQESSTSTQMSNYIQRPEVLLQTLRIRIRNKNKERVIRAMMDSGSQCSYIKRSLAQEMNLTYLGKEQVIHQTFGAVMSKQVEHPVYSVEVSGMYEPHRHWYSFNASAIDEIAKDIVAPPAGPWMAECNEHGIRLTDAVTEASDIDLLIGGNITPYMQVGLQSTLLPSNLIARESKIGWFLEGKIKGSERTNSTKAMVCINMMLSTSEVSKLWSLDVLGITDTTESRTRKELEEAALNHFKGTVTRSESGRFKVHLPFIEGHPAIPSNRNHAVARLHHTTKDLISKNRLEDYHNIFKSWLDEGIIERVPATPGSGLIHYLPHRAVYKENSTTPTRPVFNASAKQKDNVSLNDCVETGPSTLERIPSILTSFRKDKVGVIADIRKAFLQIEVTEAHRDALRLVWWEDLTRKKIVEYRHCRVVFGLSSSPFLLGATLQHLMDLYEGQYSSAVKLLRNGFYVDNAVASLPSVEQARSFQKEATALLAQGQFDLRGWEYGPAEEEKIAPVLGLLWNTKLDTLQLDIARLNKKPDVPTTKRILLAYANSLFDSLGFMSPFSICIKMLFKKACFDERKFNWDSELPAEYHQELEKWKQQLSLVQEIKIPRCVGSANSTEHWTLHCFNDACKEGYATCIYLRINANPVRVHIIQARARVTPSTVLTIPRGELLACLIGARLVEDVKRDLGVTEVPVTYWSDSTTALTWIRREDAVWGTFVNNRVREIRQLTKINEWRHVPGSMNPADIPSRGCYLDKLIAQKWWEGPAWLYQHESTFPNSDPVPDEIVVAKEKKKTVVSALVKSTRPHFIEDLLRHEDYHVILRIIAYVQRFVKNKITQVINPMSTSTPEISAEEMVNAELQVIHYIQQATWGSTVPALGFPTEVDADGIIRTVTRLVNGKDDEDFQKPALLPGDHPMVKKMIMKEHSLSSHAGVQYLQSKLRERYWITHSRRPIRKVVHKCPICRLHTAKRCQVPAAPLPQNRTKTGKCFQVIGVDMAGPLYLRNGQKVWIIIFTCAVYRAVHFEVVASSSTAAFINALRKFVARRGRPTTIYSDNGTNFHGCQNLFKKINWTLIQRHAAVHKIEWIFNPPTASWWGGFWERLIGLMKQLLRRVLGKRTVDLDELEVLVMEAESVMNERPLTYLSEDAADLRPLTPAMFIRDLPVSCLPEVDISAKELNRRFRYCLRMKEELRRRFRSGEIAQEEVPADDEDEEFTINEETAVPETEDVEPIIVTRSGRKVNKPDRFKF